MGVDKMKKLLLTVALVVMLSVPLLVGCTEQVTTPSGNSWSEPDQIEAKQPAKPKQEQMINVQKQPGKPERLY